MKRLFMCIKWWQKILSIPLIIFLYLFIIDALSSSNVFSSSISETQDMGGMLNIGLGQAVGISVTRSYFGGAMQLPIYSGAIGDIGAYHNLFFNYFIYIYTAIIILSLVAEFMHIEILSKIFGKSSKKPTAKKAYKYAKRKQKGGRYKW